MKVGSRSSVAEKHPVDQVLPAPQMFLYGLQHVLSMYAGVVAVPLIIGTALKLSPTDITYLVSDYLQRLEPSAFWQQDIKGQSPSPIVAIWPIQNATTQHLDDQMLTLLSSIETALVNTNSVRVVDRGRQEALAEEIGIQHGAAFDPSSAQRLGRQLGAQYFFTGKITSVDERLSKLRRVQYSLFLQVIETETGLIKFQNEVARSKAVQR